MNALDRVEKLTPLDAEHAAYRSNVLREQAKLERDPARVSALVAEANRLSAQSRSLWTSVAPAAPAPVRLRVGGEVKAPVIVSRVEPVYPEEAKKARATGNVILEVVVGTNGRVIETKVVAGLPHGLDAAAEAAVKQYMFRPATLNGQPVEVTHVIAVNLRPPAE
jgi:TonB family protein